jgi:hypothetical protein
MKDRVKFARSLMDSEPDACHGLCIEILRDEPDNALALFMIGVLMIRADRQGAAIPVLERVCRLKPERVEAWQYLGMAWQECHQPLKAREAFRRAHEIKPSASTMGNIGVTYLDEGNAVEAIRWVRKAIASDPQFKGGQATLGFAQLSLGNWEEGWKNYEACLGGRFRKKLDFGAPDWDGSEVESLIVYGEQGLGDEIMFASCLPDVIQRAKHVTLECDARLEGLFKRSFPTVEVHGTRREEQPWRDGRTWDAQVACGSLPSLFRPTPKSCPAAPYLTADPERRIMWRALFDSWKKPVIGLTWSGGRPASQKAKRDVGLDAFRGLIQTTDAVFVSLQYQDPSEEIAETGLPVRTFPALMSDEYDDTAALVAELDYMVGIHTTSHHLAGSLGKSSTILVPHLPMWNYAHGDRLAWYADNVFHRQKKDEKWADCLKRLDLFPLKVAA